MLIELWENHKNLYNTKLKSYFNRDLRQKSLESIESVLKENEITASIKQISKKLTDLKNYYGCQRRLIESSKSSRVGTDEVYVSQWKFYESLQFLNDAFTPRKTKSNADDEDDNSPYADTKPPSKSNKKIAQAQNNELHKVMGTATTALQSVISKKNEKLTSEGPDSTYGKLLIEQLPLIPECNLKYDLKICLQQIILQCKRQVLSSNSRHDQTTPATAHNPTPFPHNPYVIQQRPTFASPQSPHSSLSSPHSSSGSFGY